MLSSIRGGTTLKHVAEQERAKSSDAGVGGSDLASILARALICRRTEMRNDDNADDENEWGDGSDDDDSSDE